MKKQNKWLDNYGKVDNANESSVSFSENFVGEGYDTEGRNYSPAWGGQFQTGGSIPGTTGFTYARMSDSNNVKGKNSNKIIPSAQKGITSPSYKKGITNEILRRQAYKESTFNPKAVSPKGYKGLTQIGEDVIKDYMKKKENKKLDPFNPKDAVELQRFAMDDLYNSSFINKPNQSDSVRIAKTLTAYNWGRGNLFNYLGEQKKKGVDIYNSYEWLNNLPKETSDYVNKIFLQKDSSFNENYKKASANPKYKSINSLYDIKKFGGEIPSAQNGQEMKFYQEGLDWKPKSIQDGGQQPLEVSTSDPRYADLYKNRQLGRWINENEFDSQVPLDEVVVTGKDERVKEYMSRYSDSFLRNALGVMGSPQTVSMELITGEQQQTPSEAWGFQEPGGWLDSYSSFGKNLSNFAMDATLDPTNLFGVGLVDDLSKGAIRQGLKKSTKPNISSSVDNLTKLGDYQRILDKGLDVHDVRLKYHNNMILDFDEHSMIDKFGKGNKANYKKALVEDVAGNMHTADVAHRINNEMSGKQILDNFLGTEQHKVTVPNKNASFQEIDTNTNVKDFIEKEQNIIKPKNFEIPSFYSAPYDRTPTSRAADKWLEDWFTNPETKQKFIDYGGSEKEWESVLNSLENPIKSKYKWGQNQPGGVYMRPFDQASIPTNASVDIGVHEGIHKAKLLLDRNNPVLHRLWNDLTDAVRLIPSEAYPEIFRFRQKLGLKPGQTIDLKTMEDNLHLISDGYSMNYKVKDKNKLLEIINKAPAILPIAGVATIGSQTIEKKKHGGVIKDNRGQWNHPGEITEIDSPYITMEDVPYPVLGISDVGDTKLMEPEKNYKFKGKKVTEYPILKNGGRTGINDLDAQPMKKLNQLLNFTNDPDNTNWLDKYN